MSKMIITSVRQLLDLNILSTAYDHLGMRYESQITEIWKNVIKIITTWNPPQEIGFFKMCLVQQEHADEIKIIFFIKGACTFAAVF